MLVMGRMKFTQAILDLMSLYEKFGKIKGLNIGIIGDVTIAGLLAVIFLG